MVSAVSKAITAVIPAVRTAGTSPTGRWYFKNPDISNEVFRAINAASACGTFMAICQAVHHQSRKGRTEAVRAAAAAGQIGIGLRELARITGSSVVTIRKHCQALHQIGVIVQHRRGCQHVADPATGRIVTKNLGRTPTTLIYLTITNDHLRPAAAKAAAERKRKGKESVPIPVSHKDSFFAPSIDVPTEHRENTVTTPVDSEAGRHPPAEAGGHSAAKAVQERVTIVSVGPDTQGIVVEDGTHNPAGGTASRPQTPTDGQRPTVPNVTLPAQQDATQEPAACGGPTLPDTGPADGTGMVPGWLEEYRRLTGKGGKPDPAQAANELREAVANLTPDQRGRCRKAVEKAAKDDPDAKAIEAMIKRRRDDERQERQRDQAAKKAAFKDAYHRDNETAAA